MAARVSLAAFAVVAAAAALLLARGPAPTARPPIAPAMSFAAPISADPEPPTPDGQGIGVRAVQEDEKTPVPTFVCRVSGPAAAELSSDWRSATAGRCVLSAPRPGGGVGCGGGSGAARAYDEG